jgi:sterol desaturase/sphingolipid hydroxylase (fatty acid hydroxylase superfamily)
MIEGEAFWRLAPFAAILAACLIAEALAPDQALAQGALKAKRWGANAGLFLLGAGLARLIAPAGVTGAAIWAQAAGVGLFNVLDAPAWLAFGLSLLALDGAVYAQHRALHAVPLLWRLHAPHHAEVDLDASSGLRFHPGEFVFSLAWKSAAAIALGAPPEAVLVFEIVLNGFALFTHANIRLPRWLEAILAPVVFTPRAHRLHHDRARGATSGNYGFSLILWDRLFASRLRGPEPEALGLHSVQPAAAADLAAMLALPLKGSVR